MIAKYVTSTHAITDTYKKLLIDVKGANVKIEPSNDDSTELFFLENKKYPYEFFIENDTLTVKLVKTRWYKLLRFGVDRSEIKLCVPKSTLEAIFVRSNTGQVIISSITCSDTIDVRINTGKINLEGVFCRAFNSKGNTGKISLNKLTATESISIRRGTGSVSIIDCSAREIFVKTGKGNVCGRLPSNMAFAVQTNVGRAEIPDAPIGEAIYGRCKIKTNAGNIKFE